MMIRIEILDGPEQAVDHSFLETELCFGSSELNQVRLTGKGVISKHAVLRLVDGQGTLIVEQAGAWVKINGTPVKESILLQPGDTVQLGEQSFVFKLIPFPQPMKKRKRALLEWVTLAALIAGGLFQAYFLIGPAISLRSQVDIPLLRATPTPRPTPNAVQPDPSPTPMPPSQIIFPTPMPIPGVDVVPDPTPLVGSEGLGSAELTREAQSMIAEKDDFNAERILEKVVKSDPDFLPALIELAKLKGRQSDFNESISLWRKVQRLSSSGSLEAMDARLELQVMERRKALLEEQVPSTPRAIPTPRAPRFITPDAFPDEQTSMVQAKPQLLIGRVRMERFPESPRYDEFRMIHFGLQHQEGTPAVGAGEITVSVTFFEQQGEKVIEARIPEPQILLKPKEGLAGGAKMDELSAAYDVPLGKGSGNRSYYGTVIQVYVDGKEINRAADPAFLLEYIK